MVPRQCVCVRVRMYRNGRHMYRYRTSATNELHATATFTQARPANVGRRSRHRKFLDAKGSQRGQWFYTSVCIEQLLVGLLARGSLQTL
jgi:hypothetical protein